MAFKRMEGFAGSVPQGFIDRNVKICPLCGTDFPHWSIDQKMQMKPLKPMRGCIWKPRYSSRTKSMTFPGSSASLRRLPSQTANRSTSRPLHPMSA